MGWGYLGDGRWDGIGGVAMVATYLVTITTIAAKETLPYPTSIPDYIFLHEMEFFFVNLGWWWWWWLN
ncbi:hypothetical protein F4775DRAFT_559208 [Biscogniauxia sp. FL1348]|nr:hypothetical protein F4775DRAFT_559208 [Biscogniauxia sp. FL1348]